MRRILFIVVATLTPSTFAGVAIAGLNDGLVAYYPFNGNALDESGNGNNGTVYGATLSPDRFGNSDSAYRFDGVNDYVDLGNGPDLDLGAAGSSYSVGAWFKTSGNVGPYGDHIIGKAPTIVNQPDPYNIVLYDPQVAFLVNTPGAVQTISSACCQTYADNVWHYAVGVRENNVLSLYVDGLLVAGPANFSISNARSTANTYIGNYTATPASGELFTGLIDDVRIYSRALTPDEIQELYTGLPASGTFHVFPQFADGRFSDGTFFRSTLMVNEKMGASTSCTLQLVGLTAGVPQGVGSSFSFPVPGFAIVPTNGTQELQTGYATLSCDTPVYANLLYTSYSPQGVKIAESTVFSSEPSEAKALVLDQTEGARLAVALANDTNAPHVYTLSLKTDTGTTQTAQVQIQATTSLARFVDELMVVPPEAQRLLEITSDDGTRFSAIGLRYTGSLFTTFPAN